MGRLAGAVGHGGADGDAGGKTAAERNLAVVVAGRDEDGDSVVDVGHGVGDGGPGAGPGAVSALVVAGRCYEVLVIPLEEGRKTGAGS